MSVKKSILFLASAFFAALLLSGCVSLGQPEEKISRNLAGKGIKTQNELYNFFVSENPDADRATVKRMATLYIQEAAEEGINSDCAFVQMCLETGFLRFGGLVTPQMHNYCGLGAIDETQRGEVFLTERDGVRAHIQHLHAYATTEDKILKNECIDRRYKYVKPRGKTQTIAGLSGTWAADPSYAVKLENLISRLEKF